MECGNRLRVGACYKTLACRGLRVGPSKYTSNWGPASFRVICRFLMFLGHSLWRLHRECPKNICNSRERNKERNKTGKPDPPQKKKVCIPLTHKLKRSETILGGRFGFFFFFRFGGGEKERKRPSRWRGGGGFTENRERGGGDSRRRRRRRRGRCREDVCKERGGGLKKAFRGRHAHQEYDVRINYLQNYESESEIWGKVPMWTCMRKIICPSNINTKAKANKCFPGFNFTSISVSTV